jgi:hypothetical protein
MLEKPCRMAFRMEFRTVSGTELPVGELASAFIKAWGAGTWIDQSRPDQLTRRPSCA